MSTLESKTWNWPFPLSVPHPTHPKPSCRSLHGQLLPGSWLPPWSKVTFPTEPSSPRGQAHKRPLQLSPAALGEEASSWNPGAARDVSRDSASSFKTHLSSSLHGATPEEGSQSQGGAAMCSRPHTREQRGGRPVRDSPAKKQASHRESNMCPNSREQGHHPPPDWRC